MCMKIAHTSFSLSQRSKLIQVKLWWCTVHSYWKKWLVDWAGWCKFKHCMRTVYSSLLIFYGTILVFCWWNIYQACDTMCVHKHSLKKCPFGWAKHSVAKWVSGRFLRNIEIRCFLHALQKKWQMNTRFVHKTCCVLPIAVCFSSSSPSSHFVTNLHLQFCLWVLLYYMHIHTAAATTTTQTETETYALTHSLSHTDRMHRI